jgi:polyvinyl alcohol dehydrogenase (cytochrome)
MASSIRKVLIPLAGWLLSDSGTGTRSGAPQIRHAGTASRANNLIQRPIPGVVLSGTMDGWLRAYAAQDGKVLWEYNTARNFPTVNGVSANGGSMSNAGPTVVGGMLFVNSGYSHHGGIVPGNVLLAFSPESVPVSRNSQ